MLTFLGHGDHLKLGRYRLGLPFRALIANFALLTHTGTTPSAGKVYALPTSRLALSRPHALTKRDDIRYSAREACL